MYVGTGFQGFQGTGSIGTTSVPRLTRLFQEMIIVLFRPRPRAPTRYGVNWLPVATILKIFLNDFRATNQTHELRGYLIPLETQA